MRHFLFQCMIISVVSLPTLAARADPIVLDYANVQITHEELVQYLTDRLLPEAYVSALQRPGAATEAVANLFIIRKAGQVAREAGYVSASRDSWKQRDASDRYALERYVEIETNNRVSNIDWEALAEEQYLLELEKHGAGEERAVSHILVSSEKRDFMGMVAQLQAIQERLSAGDDFTLVATEMSDDPSAERNGGEIGFIQRGDTDPAFEKAVFAMTKEGEISPPVLSSFGVHLIRYEGRRQESAVAFSSIKSFIIERLKKEQIPRYRKLVLETFREEVAPQLPSIDEAALSQALLESLLGPPQGDAE